MGFVEKKMKIVELFLAEKLACMSIKEVPRRCMRVMYANKEIWKVDGMEILEVSAITTEEGNPSYKFDPILKSNYKLLQDIIEEVYSDN